MIRGLATSLSLRGIKRDEASFRLRRSNGSQWATDASYDDYEPDARIAREWQPALADDEELFADKTDLAFGNAIGVVKIGEEPLAALRDSVLQHLHEAEKAQANALLSQTVMQLCRELPQAGWHLDGAPLYMGMSFAAGGKNTTVNEATGKRVGLHLDNFDRLPLDQRAGATNRLCINLGTSPRALQFVPYEAREMLRYLLAMGFDPDGKGRWPNREGRRLDLARSFLFQCPDVSAFALKVMPGEGYIAPTENMIHDGLMVEPDKTDVTLTVRGRFKPYTACL